LNTVNILISTKLHIHVLFITSTEEVLFSSPFVCLCVRLAALYKTYSTDFHKIWWNGGTWAVKETNRFW